MLPKSVSRVLLSFGAALIIFLSAVPFCSQSQPSPQSSLAEQLPEGAMHDKAVTACTECHEARILVQQRLSKAAWAKEVDKMVKWGAFVEASDRDALIDYLSSNFAPDRAPYIPARTSSTKAGRKRGTSR